MVDSGVNNSANGVARYRDRGYVLEELHEAIFTAAELLALTDAELDQLDALDGDVPAEARWWREWRQRRAKRDSGAEDAG
jgi:hypothetical protein